MMLKWKFLPDGGFIEPFVLLPLPENVKITAGTKLSQKTEPFRSINGSIKSRQKRMIKRFKYFSLCLRSSFLTSTNKLLLIHHFRRKHRRNLAVVIKFSEVDRADVAGAETVGEAEVGGEDATRRGFGLDPVNG